MTSSKIRIVGSVLTALLGLLFIYAGIIQIIPTQASIKDGKILEISIGKMRLIGLLQIVISTIFLIPKTGVLGTLLLTAFLGGATYAQLNHGIVVWEPILLLSAVWLTAYIRFQELFQCLYKK